LKLGKFKSQLKTNRKIW